MNHMSESKDNEKAVKQNKHASRINEYIEENERLQSISDRAALREILADLIHFAEEKNIDFNSALSCAKRYKEIDEK